MIRMQLDRCNLFLFINISNLFYIILLFIDNRILHLYYWSFLLDNLTTNRIQSIALCNINKKIIHSFRRAIIINKRLLCLLANSSQLRTTNVSHERRLMKEDEEKEGDKREILIIRYLAHFLLKHLYLKVVLCHAY